MEGVEKKHNMLGLVSKCLFVCFLMMIFGQIDSFGQVEYTIKLDADKQTYRVFMRSQTSYSGIQAKISTAQVTLVVPNGVGVNQFQPTNILGKQVGSNSMSWGVSRSDSPTENQTKDYISFGFSGSGSPIIFDIPENSEIELFSFRNTNTCLGEVALITNSDPFLPPNSRNSNPGNQITILGFGASNAYSGNYGNNPTCLSGSTDLRIAVSGPSNVSVGSNATYTFTTENIGTNSSNGLITQTLTIPAGFVYNSASGTSWTVSATSQTNGSTILTATSNSIVAAGGVSSPISVSVTPSNTNSNGDVLNISGIISGGNDNNLLNNSSSIYSTVIVNTVDLNVAFNGLATVNPGANANYTLSVSNIGNSNSSGNVTASVILPIGVSYSSFSGSGWTLTNTTTLSNGSTQLNFSYSNVISTGGSANLLNVVGLVANNLSANTILQSSSTVSGGGDASPSNNTGSVSTTVVVAASPTIIGSFNIFNNLVGGTPGTLILNLSNSGTGPTTGNITNTFTLPPGFQFNSFSGNGWSVTAAPQANGTTVLTANYSGVINIDGTATPLNLNITPPSQGGSFQITNLISGGGGTGSSNSYTINVSTAPIPILNTSIIGPSSVNTNTAYNYGVTINNSGSGNNSGPITVNTILPIGVTFNSASGTNWSSTFAIQPNGTTLVTSIYSGIVSPNGTSSVLNINVTPQSSLANGQIITISGTNTGGNSLGGNFSINSTVVNTALPSDLAVMANISNQNPSIGQQIQYTFTITNNGPGTPNNIQSSIQLPQGFIITNSLASAGNYNSGTLTWSLNSLAVGQTQTLTIFGYPTVQGIDYASIIISNSSLADSNSKNNSAKVCYATPISLCQGEGFKAYLEAGATGIRWFKDNIQIPTITADSLLITSTGLYSAIYTNACGEVINSPGINIMAGSVPNAPLISALKNTICSPETLQLTATNCFSDILWNTGATSNTINVTTSGNYSAKCINSCGESQSSVPFVVTQNCLGAIGDYVWFDANNNGQQDIGEIPVAGVVFELFRNGITTGRKDTTDVNGKYLFDNLLPDIYQVKIIKNSIPSSYSLSTKTNQIGVPDGLDSDFDYVTGMSQSVLIANGSNLSVDAGLKTKPEANINDPCRCFNVEYTLNEKKELFETITVNSGANETWKIIEQSGMLALDSTVKYPVQVGTSLIQVQSGKYKLDFTHEDSVGYFVKVSNGIDTLEIGNFCSVYPYVAVTELEGTVCKNADPIPLTFQMNVPGNARYFYVDKQTLQKVYITEFDPKKFTSGETIYIKLDVTPSNGQMCTWTLSQAVTITSISCEVCEPIICLPINIKRIKLN